MTKISEGISKQSKEKMVSVLERKNEEAKYLKESIVKEAQKIVDEGEKNSSYWLNASTTKLTQLSLELSKLEGEMGLLTVYSREIEVESK